MNNSSQSRLFLLSISLATLATWRLGFKVLQPEFSTQQPQLTPRNPALYENN
jgi:hypothetical protein